MQAVLLAAGQSSRFYPLREFPHKSAATLLGKPLFMHTLESVKKAGIHDVVIVVGKNNFIAPIAGDGSSLGLTIRYVVQDAPTGMGDALLKAENHLHDAFFVLHAHHVEFAEVVQPMQDMAAGRDVVLLAREENDVERFGVLEIKDEKVVGIVEKPAPGKEPSHLRVIGIYHLTKPFIATLAEEQPDHYNFESALSRFAKSNVVRYVATEINMVSLKHPWDLLEINKHLLHNATASISKAATISEKATLSGKVIIEDEVVVMEGAVIKGPCYIGKGTKVGTNAILRDAVTIGENCVIGAHLEIKHSIMFDRTKTHSGFIGDSVIGSNNKIAAFFSSANVRLDRKNIRVKTPKGDVDSGLRDLGVLMGSGNVIGSRVSTMPGIIIGNNVTVGPSTTVLRPIADNTTYYTRFHEIVTTKDGVQQMGDELITDNRKLVLFDIDYTLFDTGTFKESQLATYNLYTEVLELLLQLEKNAQLGIFSEGDLDFQKTKLLKTDIIRHFLEENIHIVESKDATIQEMLAKYKDKEVFLVDDKLPVLYAAKQIMSSIVTIWVKRGIYAENQKPIAGFTADYEVTDLKDVATIVEEKL